MKKRLSLIFIKLIHSKIRCLSLALQLFLLSDCKMIWFHLNTQWLFLKSMKETQSILKKLKVIITIQDLKNVLTKRLIFWLSIWSKAKKVKNHKNKFNHLKSQLKKKFKSLTFSKMRHKLRILQDQVKPLTFLLKKFQIKL